MEQFEQAPVDGGGLQEQIDTLNGKLTQQAFSLTAKEGIEISSQDCYVINKTVFINIVFNVNTPRGAYYSLFELPSSMLATINTYAPLMSQYMEIKTTAPSMLYIEKGSSLIRQPGTALSAGTYIWYATFLIS